MIKRKWFPLFLLSVGIVALLAYFPSGASDDNWAALVVDYGNGQVATRCVSFTEETISGFDLLERSGLPVETDFQSGGAAVCRINGQGCPTDDCFCACRGGGDCIYWAYWHQLNGVWTYSAAGSALYQVADGAVEGWVWGLGSVTQATPPPLVAFGEICAAEATPTPTTTPSRAATPIVLPTVAPTTGQYAASATATMALATSTTAAPADGTIAPFTVTATADVDSAESTPQATPGGAAVVTTRPAPAPTIEPQPPPVEPASGVLTPAPPTESALAAFIGTTPFALAATTTVTDDGPATPAWNLVEPAAGQVIAGIDRDAIPSPTAPVVAVVGQKSANEATYSPMSSTAPASSSPDLVNYAGFAGLALLLFALALGVYRRRIEARQMEQR